jgi:hypothetical protein
MTILHTNALAWLFVQHILTIVYSGLQARPFDEAAGGSGTKAQRDAGASALDGSISHTAPRIPLASARSLAKSLWPAALGPGCEVQDALV